MAKAVLLSGNGYIGRATNEAWMKADLETEFYVISRSGRNKLTDKRIHNLRADVSDYEEVKAVLPEDFDYIVDFVGAPENDPEKFKRINVMPAKVMKRLAEEYKAKKMGFIAGSLGPKSFVQGKADLEIPAGQLSSFGICFSDHGVWQWPQGWHDPVAAAVEVLRDFSQKAQAGWGQ